MALNKARFLKSAFAKWGFGFPRAHLAASLDNVRAGMTNKKKVAHRVIIGCAKSSRHTAALYGVLRRFGTPYMT